MRAPCRPQPVGTFLHIPFGALKREGLAPLTKQRIPHKKNRLEKRRERTTSVTMGVQTNLS